MKKRKIYLHIGCGKTGSSAIQLWLHNNAEHFMKAGIHYPAFGAGRLDDYSITSGNGVHVIGAFANGELPELLGKIAHESKNDILISTEHFQSLNGGDLLKLKKALADHDLAPVIVAYVRDVYDIIYSSYLQLVKRHLCTQTFREFALTRREVQQFKVLQLWSEIFDDVRVVHYDSEKACLDKSFCAAVGIGNKGIPTMPNMKVNRSLTLEEAELLRLINTVYVGKFESPDQNLSRIVSDALIMADPEAPTPILVDEEVIDYVGAAFMDGIDWMNDRFFMGKAVLSVFNPEGKYIAAEMPRLGKCTEMAVRTLFDMVDAFAFGGEDSARRKAERQKGLEINDPRIVDALRDEAVRRERDSLADALALMGAARTLRPAGAYIVKKVDEYKSRLDAVQA